MRVMLNAESLASQLAGLKSLDRAALVVEWKKINNRPPPANLSRGLLLRAVAYQLQEKALGGLSKSLHAQLSRIARTSDGCIRPSSQPNPGTRLLREWRGVTHEVLVHDDGVQYRGQKYRSLSEVAKVITGSKWSGPVFFGLRKREK